MEPSPTRTGDADVCTQPDCKEDGSGTTGTLIKKYELGAASSKSVVVLKRSDVTIRNGCVFMPNTIEMAQIKKQEKGQFKTNMAISSRMTDRDIKRVLVEAFPLLEGQSFYCAAAVDNRTRLDFHGRPRIWDGLSIRRKIKGNSALYIFTDESSLKRSYDEITREENEKSEQCMRKEMDLSNASRLFACSSKCLELGQQSTPTLFAVPTVASTSKKVLINSSSVGQGATHLSQGSTVLEKSNNFNPPEGPFLVQKLHQISPMTGCFLVPVSAQQSTFVVSSALPSSESRHQEKSNTTDVSLEPASLSQTTPLGASTVMASAGDVHQGAVVQKANISSKQSTCKEIGDSRSDTEHVEGPTPLQSVPHIMISSGLSPRMHNLNIADSSSMQSRKEHHVEKITQKRDQSAQTRENSEETFSDLPSTATSAECSTVMALREANFWHVAKGQFAETREKILSEDEARLSDSGMEASDHIEEGDNSKSEVRSAGDFEMESKEKHPKQTTGNTDALQDNSHPFEDTSASKLAFLCDVALKVGIKDESSEKKIKLPSMEEKTTDVAICPMNGPMSGGSPFYISLNECLPGDVKSAVAIFGAVGSAVLRRLDEFKFVGLKIPAASAPGVVTVIVQASDGQYLGTTVFTYVDEEQEVLRRFITSGRLQAKFFAFLAEELKVPRKSETDEEKARSRCSCSDQRGLSENFLQRFRQLDQGVRKTDSCEAKDTRNYLNATGILQQFRHLNQILNQEDDLEADNLDAESDFFADDEASYSGSSDDGNICHAKKTGSQRGNCWDEVESMQDLENIPTSNSHHQESRGRRRSDSVSGLKCYGQENRDEWSEGACGNNKEMQERSHIQEDTEISEVLERKEKGSDFDENSISDQRRRAQYSREGDESENHPAGW
ncbi:uncharacterized protein [Montipora capricornis]|uniref:uncharacterized protein isoform X1 n=1 Tax=Montipora capricornis TaxID=246305 RepID=UPI0035F17BFF